jgi:outer membrane receptor protein involved in Fe transport
MNRFRRHTLSGALFVAIGICGAMPNVHAQDAADRKSFNVPAQPAASALNTFAAQADITLVFSQDLVQGITTHPLQGNYTTADGLQAMLEGTGLSIQRINGSTISIGDGSRTSEAGYADTTLQQESAKTLASITVTGTRIRGGTTPSPVITIGSDQMQQEGFSDLGEVIRSVPQNFNGGQNPGVAGVSSGSNSNQNITGGSGLNLRGLGPDATLTLLNGHRMSYGGFSQAVDISAIPIEAVQRIEIVPDGASAIYGSDAVGGVANVILKRDFNGVTAGARYGGATEGGLITREYNATAGTTWATGGLIVAGEKTSNDPIYSDQRDYTQSRYQPSTLWQGSKLRSGLFSLHQSLGDAVELRLDALGSNRKIHTELAYPEVYYPYNVETKTTLLAPSLEIWLPGDWTLTLSGAMGKEKNSSVQPTVNRADGTITSDGLAGYRNKSLTYEMGAEGPLFTLPGGEARLAMGVGYRYNEYLDTYGSTIDTDGDESSRFAYAELNLPLVEPKQGVGGIDRLELTGAIRTEDGNYGRVTTPKLGVIYSPSVDVSLKASWGKSFKAPTLWQHYSTAYAFYMPVATYARGGAYPADATVLDLEGGSQGLSPERARTWSGSLMLHPEALPQFEMELTWFDIEYTQRVVKPLNPSDFFLGNPGIADYANYDPTEAAQAAALASSKFYNYVGVPYDASKVVAMIDNRLVNASAQRIRGGDLSGSYRFDLGTGRLTVRGSASWLDSSQALTAKQKSYNLAGTLFNPAKINSRIGAVWQQDGFTASLFGNYKSGVTNTEDGRKGASFTTFDATLRYGTGVREDAWSNLTLELSAQNLLNRAPPLYVPVSWTFTPYDATNYSAIGRFVSVSVSKHW